MKRILEEKDHNESSFAKKLFNRQGPDFCAKKSIDDIEFFEKIKAFELRNKIRME